MTEGEMIESPASYEPRIRRIAHVLDLTWVPGAWVDRYDGRWWIVGTAGGDHPLPRTSGCRTLGDAVDAAEAWLGL